MLSIAVQMDPIRNIHIEGDTTFAFMLMAQERGHKLTYFEPKNVFYEGGKIFAECSSVEVRDDAEKYYNLYDERTEELSKFDVVLVRQDPPFDMGYVANTYMLELIGGKTIIVNSPMGLRNV